MLPNALWHEHAFTTDCCSVEIPGFILAPKDSALGFLASARYLLFPCMPSCWLISALGRLIGAHLSGTWDIGTQQVVELGILAERYAQQLETNAYDSQK